MSDIVEPQLSASLAAWRAASRRAPRSHATERARDAMLAALVSPHATRRRRSWMLRPRFAHSGAIAAMATVVAAAGVAAAGWNAPPGSALFVIRAARQSVQLKLPGTNDAALHLQFAEQSLADARAHVNPQQSLTDARAELNAALLELPTDRSSALWNRYSNDETTLASEESGLGNEDGTPPAGSGARAPQAGDTPGSPGSSPADDNEGSRSHQSSSSTPSAWPGGGDGSDDESPRPSSSGTPPPDN
ncbi:MAG TPA: hypothetical protein VMU65_06745 [Candidatus Saccharimonadales bacterium]|nr:hypothetical protein [Candidatus Saccharimonadales bacterium]